MSPTPPPVDTGSGTPPLLAAVPVCVDLDGTLLKTDTLLEAVLQLIRLRWSNALQALNWMLRGRAEFKAEVARRVELDVAQLPVNHELLEWLGTERRKGRRIVLSTAAPEPVARAVAARFDLFDEVLCSDPDHNLSGHRKAARLAGRFGERGFDYAGNAARDLPVWRRARAAIVVTPTLPLALQRARIPRIERVFARPPGAWRDWLRALRPHQWAKNLLVFVPALTSHRLLEPEVLAACTTAFVAFCLAASGTYLVNDLLDLEADRNHPSKRLRPLASGRLQVTEGIALAIVLIGGAIVVGYASLGIPFTVMIVGYLLVTLWYSFDLKQRAGADILCLAGLYTLRVLAGSVATQIEASFWLLAFSMFLFLSLAAAKRATELGELEIRRELRSPGRGYLVSDLPLLLGFGIAAAYCSVLVLALYLFARAEIQYTHPQVLWLLCPVLLYWVSRIWLKTHRRQLHEDPVVFALTDRPSQLVALAFVAIAWFAT